MRITDDPVADFLRYDREQQRELDKRPKCDICGEPLYECGYMIDGELICQECLDDNYKIKIFD